MPWCYTALTPKIGPLDARAMLPVLLTAVHFTLTTLTITFTIAVVFSILLYFGYSPAVALRLLRSRMTGTIHPAFRHEIWGRRVEVRRRTISD